jgi:ABC-type branched-subunit amino acid transport system substrate-binding protein
VLDIGKGIFRLFPADGAGAELLLSFMATRHRRVGILTEQNEYPVMMERIFRRANSKLPQPLEIVSDEFVHGQTDLKTTLLKITSNNIDALFINANSDHSFISAVKQLATLQFKGARYAVYLPAAKVAKEALGGLLEGFEFANLPLNESIVTAKGREVLETFKKRFGEPNSGFPVVPLTLESFRIFDMALSSGREPAEYLSSTKFSGGLVPDFHFDEHGAVQGINFDMQRIDNGNPVTIAQ